MTPAHSRYSMLTGKKETEKVTVYIVKGITKSVFCFVVKTQFHVYFMPWENFDNRALLNGKAVKEKPQCTMGTVAIREEIKHPDGQIWQFPKFSGLLLNQGPWGK